MDDHDYLLESVRLSREKMHEHLGGPFGAIVVADGRIVGRGWNHVTSSNDPTAHAEVSAIRDACRTLGTFDLTGAVIYSSCEPCPMCLGAIYWAHIDRIYFANTSEDAAAIGFDDAYLYEQLVLPAGRRALPCEHLPSDEARAVFAEWAAMADKIEY